MVDPHFRYRRLRDLVDESRLWDAELMLRNAEEELARFEQGLAHLVMASDEKFVTKPVKPMPVTPSFEVEEDETEYVLRVRLPGIPADSISVDVDPDEVEVFACAEQSEHRPYYLKVRASSTLDVETAEARFGGGSLEVRVRKVWKRLVPVA